MLELHKLFGAIMDEDRVQNEKRRNDDRKIIIYKSELDYLSKCILESPQMETGGTCEAALLSLFKVVCSNVIIIGSPFGL